MAGILDSSRFKFFLSLELNISVKEIESLVMGGHGDTMVPLPRMTKVSGVPLIEMIKNGKITQKKMIWYWTHLWEVAPQQSLL